MDTDIREFVIEGLRELADKLGTTADKVWEFSVKAQVIEAKASLGQALIIGIMGLSLFSGPVYVMTTKLSHDVRLESQEVKVICDPNDSTQSIYSLQSCLDGHQFQYIPSPKDNGLTERAQVEVALAIIMGLAGFIMLSVSACNLVEAWAWGKTTESRAFSHLVRSLRGLRIRSEG